MNTMNAVEQYKDFAKKENADFLKRVEFVSQRIKEVEKDLAENPKYFACRHDSTLLTKKERENKDKTMPEYLERLQEKHSLQKEESTFMSIFIDQRLNNGFTTSQAQKIAELEQDARDTDQALVFHKTVENLVANGMQIETAIAWVTLQQNNKGVE